MKLIDLLIQELPKRGGWPEGVSILEQYSKGQVFEIESDYCSDFRFEKADDWIGGTVTRDQYQSALAASHRVEWSGDGLPPVGCECEWQDKNTKQWQPVKVVYASEWVTVIREINKDKGDDLVEVAIENYGDDARLKFRPLRSEADKKRDAVAECIYRAINWNHNGEVPRDSRFKDYCNAYDAIAAGKIPGVKLDGS